MAHIYDYSSYKIFLKETLQLFKEKYPSKRFSHQGLSDACKIQKSYFSRVFRDAKTHLSAEQLEMACRYLDMEGAQIEFALLLLELAKTQDSQRRERLDRKIQKLKTESQTSEKVLSSEVVSPSSEVAAEFFLDPYLQVVHLFFSVERYREDPQKISRDLGFSAKLLDEKIRKLEKLGFLKFEKGKYHSLKKSMHLPAKDPIYPAYRALLRSRSLDQAQRMNADDVYSFSVLFSTKLSVRDKIHREYLTFLAKVEKWVKEDTAKDRKTGDLSQVYQMNFDIIPWSRE